MKSFYTKDISLLERLESTVSKYEAKFAFFFLKGLTISSPY